MVPSMYPVLFEIPGLGFPLRSFGVMLALAFLVGVHLAGRFSERFGDDPVEAPARLSQVGLAVLIGIVVGARLFYVSVEVLRYLVAEDGAGMTGQKFISEPFEMFAVWNGGLVMYGGMLGAMLFGVISARRQALRKGMALDLGLAGGFFGQATGRIGCLLVGDDYGSVVPEAYAELPFPVTLTVPSLEWLQANPESLFEHRLAGEVLWGTQVWMCVNALCIGLFALWHLRKRRYPGHTALWIVLLYAITRAIIEDFRGDEIRGVWVGGLSTSQMISGLAGLVAAYFLFRWRARREPMPDAQLADTPPTAAS